MEAFLTAIAAPVTTLLIALAGLLIAQKLGIGPKQQELIKTLQDLIAAQKLKIDNFTADTTNLTQEITSLRKEIQELKDTILSQAKEIRNLTENRITRRRRSTKTTNEFNIPKDDE